MKIWMWLFALIVAVTLVRADAAIAAPPRGDPAGAGFDTKKILAIDAALKDAVQKGLFPGGILAVVRDNKLALLSISGKVAPGGADMPVDAIFRIYSMTKPIVSVAAMRLVEQKKLSLDEPVSTYFPKFGTAGVAVTSGKEGKSFKIQPLRRPVKIKDLLNHTAGIANAASLNGKLQKLYADASLNDPGSSNQELASKLAALPLVAQPGRIFFYAHATDLLGAVIEKVTGQPLGEAVAELVTRPLGMVDTGFHVADPSKAGKIAQPFPNDQFGPTKMFDPLVRRKLQAAGNGMVSTVQDYLRFCQMLLKGGTLANAKLLSPITVRAMTRDRLGAASRQFLPEGYTFGLGFGVRRNSGSDSATPGTYYWNGAGGTSFFIDPDKKLVVVYMMQSPRTRINVREYLREAIYGAMVR